MVDAIFVPAGFEARAVRFGLKRAASRIKLITVPADNDRAQETAMRALNTKRIERALIVGVCGLLSPELQPGDAVIYADVRTSDFEPIKTDSLINEQLRSLFPEAYRNAHGLTWPSVVTEPNEKTVLASNYGASAIDTESFGIMSALLNARVGCGILRFGSDALGHSMPNVNAAVRPDGTLNNGRLFLEMLRRPIGAMRLVLGGSVAISKMARAVERIARAT